MKYKSPTSIKLLHAFIQLPMLVLGAVLLLISSLGSYKLASTFSGSDGLVLGKDDSGDDDHDDNSGSGSDSSGKGSDSDEDKESDDKEDEGDKSSEDEHEDEDENENEHEFEVEDEDDSFDDSTTVKFKFESDTQNSQLQTEGQKSEFETEYIDQDGNLVKIKYKVEDDGRVKYEYKYIYRGQERTLESSDSELPVSPQEIVDDISDDSIELQDLSLETNDDNQELEYRAKIQKSEKLFGVFDVNLSSMLVFDPETGELIGVDQSFITKLLDFLSF